MKKFGLFITLFITSNLFSQTLLLNENFDYGTTATDLVTASSSVWLNHDGGTGADDVQYLTTGLSYTGYVSSGIGGSASVSNSRSGDDSRTFSSQTSGSVYLSALVNVASATTSTSGSYFIHFGNTSTHYARLFVRTSSSNLLFGISKAGEGVTFSTTNFSFNTTYLIVMKYTFSGGAQDDRVDLWVISSGVPATEIEAGTPTVENITAANTDASSLSAISLRQGGNAYSASVDGIRVSDDWSQAPLPVELSSFSASIINEGVKLNWVTETEVNNYGFEIERKTREVRSETWEILGFVDGHGNSNSPKDYSFVDNNVTAGKHSYRLKQIDNDGKFEYSKVIEIDVGTPLNYELTQNYPNPFNPSTTIKFSIPENSSVSLKIYNSLGQEIKTLINRFMEAGVHNVNFSATGLNSGMYFYRLDAGKFTQVRKMTLIK